MTTIEIRGYIYEWRNNTNLDTRTCKLCAGFNSSEVCAASCCDEMPPFKYLVEKRLAQPKLRSYTPSEARREAAGS